MESSDLNRLGQKILDASLRVHRAMGPGLLESVYEECLIEELQASRIRVRSQVPTPLEYRGRTLKGNLWIDLLVEDEVIIELKAIEAVHPVHKAQVISYLKLADKRLGYLINFHVPKIKEGFFRFVNGL